MDHLKQDCDISDIPVDLVAHQPDIIPRTKDDFHRFPEAQGWELDDDFRLNIRGYEESKAPPLAKFAALMQAWLYFGLIFTVVQVDGQPTLEYEDLREGQYLSTAKLHAKVEEWVRWEIQNPDGRWIRLIQVGYVLEKARQVVRRNCACDLKEDDHMRPSADGGTTVEKKLSVKAEGYHYQAQKKGDGRHMTDENALALMLVGECLWAAKSRIVQRCGASLSGWHGDDDSGWGPPRYVLWRMIRDRWCPRAVVLLRGQLRSSATLLLHAYVTYSAPKSDRMTVRHEKCDRDTCRAKTEDGNGNYTSLCLPDCELHDKGGCAMVGPKMREVLEILSSTNASKGESDIPLIRFESTADDQDRVSFTVERLRLHKPQAFATVSHVWSDGWGNEDFNKLRSCQLRFIRRALRRANNGKDIPFWMDTLVVPVKKLKEGEQMDEGWRALKTKAIGQIFEVFARSSYTIILDNGLCGMPPGRQARPAEAAMKILASGWMRRLWTLHEAFLSKKRYVTFREQSHEHYNLKDLEELLDELNTAESQESPLVSWVRDLLLQNIMDKESKTLADPEMRLAQRQAAMLVAGTWRAARWRTTSNAAHETLALATLLNITYQGTEIEEAGLELNAAEDKKNRLVRDFWREFHTTYKNCIPAGIIFLPGEKVQLDGVLGYGWAPRTWMSAHEVDYPDPLSRWTAETDLLEGKGLLVQYPGFILHTDGAMSRKKILAVDQSCPKPMFTFPVDNSLLEWYSVKPAEPKQKEVTYLEGILTSTHPLAIILSRPQPKAWPAEIGLLVEVYSINEDKIRKEGDDASATTYCCQIIHRVHVWRETRERYLTGPGRNGPKHPIGADGKAKATPHWEIIGGPFDSIKQQCCVGETLSSTQKWIVDGYVVDRGKRKVTPKVPTSAAPGAQRTASIPLMTPALRPAPGPFSATTNGPFRAEASNHAQKRAAISSIPAAPPHRAATMSTPATNSQPKSTPSWGIVRAITAIGFLRGDKNEAVTDTLPAPSELSEEGNASRISGMPVQMPFDERNESESSYPDPGHRLKKRETVLWDDNLEDD